MKADLSNGCLPVWKNGFSRCCPIDRHWICMILAFVAMMLFCWSPRASHAATKLGSTQLGLPRIIRLIRSVPDSYARARHRLTVQQDEGSPGFSFSFRQDEWPVGPRSYVSAIGLHESGRPRWSVQQFAHGNRAAALISGRHALRYTASAGISRNYFLFDTQLIATVFVANRKSDTKPAAALGLPAWLSNHIRDRIRERLDAPFALLPPISRFNNGLIPGAGYWNSATATLNPCRIKAIGNSGQAFIMLRFAQWKRGRSLPLLTAMRGFMMKNSPHGHVVMAFALRTGRLAVPMPVHLSPRGLRKLGFTIVRLKADTPAPEINPLTHAQRAQMRIMRRRFEQWAGVWQSLKHPPSLKAVKK